jgi:hypothetical protein
LYVTFNYLIKYILTISNTIKLTHLRIYIQNLKDIQNQLKRKKNIIN